MKLYEAEKIVKQNVPESVYAIAERFIKHNYKIYLVGGVIRDILLRREYNKSEIDLATDARPDDVKRIFGYIIPTGIKHGTVTVIRDSVSFEITTFRLDGKYSNGRHPDRIEYATTIEEDLKRRDFTINAFAFDLEKNVLLDLFDGLRDLKRRIIRTIGNPDERFREDGLRLMRAIRFATVLGFTIEEITFRSISKNIDMLQKVAMERIRDEFTKIMQSDKPSKGIELLRRTEILRIIMPELLTGFGIKQNKFHKYDIYYHNLYTTDATPKDNLAVRLAALLHDISKPYTKRIPEDRNPDEATFYNHEVIGAIVAKKILKRLKFSNEIVDKVTSLVRHHMFYYTDEWTDSAVRRFIRKVGLELIPELFILREADRVGGGIRKGNSYHLQRLQEHIEKILEEENAFSLKDLKVNGYDVMKIKNIPPSPAVGKILNYLLEVVLENPEKNTRDELIKLIEEFQLEDDNAEKSISN